MNYILFDDKSWDNLLPLTFIKPVCEVSSGILTIKEKWEKVLDVKLSYLTQKYLQAKYLLNVDDDNILINGSVIPNAELLNKIESLKLNEALVSDHKTIAVRLDKQGVSTFNYTNHNQSHIESIHICTQH